MSEPRTRLVSLTDGELLLLDGCRPEIQAKVDDARTRLDMANALPELTPAQAGLVADAVSMARKEGCLRWMRRSIDSCSVCGTRAGYARYKSGPRRGEQNLSKPLHLGAIDLDPGLVHIRGHVSLGACGDCMDALRLDLAEQLRGVPAELPDLLVAEGEPKRKRYGNRRCTECGWEGHEGQMTKRPTLMGDGFYPAGCPSCNAENRPLSSRIPVESVEGFVVVELEQAR